MENAVIKVDHVSKIYRLGQYNNDTFFRDLQSWVAHKRGKEDPNKKIGYVKQDKEYFYVLQILSSLLILNSQPQYCWL